MFRLSKINNDKKNNKNMSTVNVTNERELQNVSGEVLMTLQQDVAEIKVALLGNAYNPAGGLLCRTTDMEQKLIQLQAKYDKVFWTAGGAAVVIAIIANFFMWVFDMWKTIGIH